MHPQRDGTILHIAATSAQTQDARPFGGQPMSQPTALLTSRPRAGLTPFAGLPASGTLPTGGTLKATDHQPCEPLSVQQPRPVHVPYGSACDLSQQDRYAPKGGLCGPQRLGQSGRLRVWWCSGRGDTIKRLGGGVASPHLPLIPMSVQVIRCRVMLRFPCLSARIVRAWPSDSLSLRCWSR